MSRIRFALMLLAAMAAPRLMRAQDATLSQMYGSGVHAYFAGQYDLALDLLNGAIDAGYSDPRAHYFRGLAHYAMGEEVEAEAQFADGAKLEAENLEQFSRVSKSLTRVQGHARLMLEKHRAGGRMVVMQQREERRRERYEAIRRAIEAAPAAEDELPVAPETVEPAGDTSPMQLPTPAAPAAADPFAEPSPTEEEMPAKPSGADAFAEPETPAAPPADAPAGPAEEADPFADPSPAPAPATTPEAPAAPPGEADPFAEPADAPPASAPSTPASPPAEEDPFAEESGPALSAPAEAPPAAPATDESDPFADETP